MLERMTAEQSIATDQKLLRDHQHMFFSILQIDPWFMGKFMHYLDVVFNTFCLDLAEYHLDKQPTDLLSDNYEG